jgi:hypothetical protein
MSRVRAGRDLARGAQREAVSREDEDAERIAREAKRLEWETSTAIAWLFDTIPDDPELRRYVHASGALLFLRRQLHRCEREAEKRYDEYVRARAALIETRDEWSGWRALEEEAVIAVERTRRDYRAAEFRREAERSDDMDVRRDHDAHVWAWMNR